MGNLTNSAKLIEEMNKKAYTTDLGAAALSNQYDDLDGKPTIPTVNNSTIKIQKNSSDVDSFTTNASNDKTINIQLTKSDVGLGNVDNTSDANKPISNATQTALNTKADANSVYTKAEVDSAISSAVSSVYKYKGSVANYASLPSTGLTAGDVYNVEDTGMNYAWTGSAWDALGSSIDLSNYLAKNNTTSFTPTGDYNPATKKYVDDGLSGKQSTLETQTAYTSKGSATKVPQITTNTLGQVTGITEVTITQPTVNDGILTIKQGGTSKGTFTANQSSASTVDLNTCFLKTQVEYDALPASKATDGNFYFIYSS